VATSFLLFTRPIHRFSSCAVGWNFTVVVCFVLAAALTSTVNADPVMGTVTLTIAGEPSPTGFSGGIAAGPVVYSSGTVQLGQVFQSEVVSADQNVLGQDVALTGPILIPNFGGLGENFRTTFQMKITFDGASGSQPTIEVTGVVMGGVAGTPEGTFNTGAFIGAVGTPQSATLEGWNPASGVPMSLINQFLNPSNYYLSQQDSYQYGSPQDSPATAIFYLTPNISALTPVPEPATVVVFLAAIAGLGVRHRARRGGAKACTPPMAPRVYDVAP
jgi:hypothetical protein